MPDDSVKFGVLYDIGNSYKAIDAHTARQYATQALDLARSLKRGVDEADALNLISSTYRIEGDFLKAKTALLQALPLWDRFHKYKGLSQGYHNLSFIIFEGEKDYDLSLAYCQKALAINLEHNLAKYIPSNYNQIGLIYKNKGRLDLARAYFLKAVQLTKKLPADQQGDLSAFYNNLSKIALEQGQPNEGLRWVGLATNLNQENNNQLSLTYSLENTARIKAYLGQSDQADKLFSQALNLARQLNAPKRSRDIYLTMSESYERAGNYEQALLAHKRFNVLDDSLFTATRARQLSELQTQYETNQKEQRIEQLNTDARDRQRQFIYLGVGSGLLIVLLGALIWQNNRIRRSRNLIRQQSDHLELLIKELHHRVKNNFALVSGLLNLQMHKAPSEETMKTAQQRIEAMSLIHQRLYQTEHLTHVNFQEFLADLTASLLRAYGFQPDDINLTLDVDVVWLDVDRAIPLGLIANELITNTLKYAYRETDKPALRVALQENPNLSLEIADNGPGFDPKSWQLSGGSFGKQLIKALTAQLNGHYELDTSSGTCFRLSIA
ncbi:sensor histidine kinase [Fibrisoma limi]|uniref:sensor histidine kinase n=1 Tax=Fibrisoma limi TaxID=663275 RepID=UPI000587BF28|nr:histidine kinase dimerization/phosphoacceptor domain -containing protein [Fibrisoma limi]